MLGTLEKDFELWLEHTIEILVESETSEVQMQQRLKISVQSLTLRIIYAFKSTGKPQMPIF